MSDENTVPEELQVLRAQMDASEAQLFVIARKQAFQRQLGLLSAEPELWNTLQDFIIAIDMMNSDDDEIARRGNYYHYCLCCSLQLVGLPTDVERVDKLLAARESEEE